MAKKKVQSYVITWRFKHGNSRKEGALTVTFSNEDHLEGDDFLNAIASELNYLLEDYKKVECLYVHLLQPIL